MARLTISRLMELSKVLTTEAGQQLREFVEYTADVIEQSLRALRNGLTFQDNMNCLIRDVTLKHNIAQKVSTDGRTPFAILIGKVQSGENYMVTGFEWHTVENGDTELTCTFSSAPTKEINVKLIVLFQ